MSLETAKQVVDLAMKSTSPYINFEFQGGEPTVNFPAIDFIVGYSREKNRYEGKRLEHSLVTNMTYMTAERADWLVANDLFVCTSLDGPEPLHNWNRLWSKGTNAFADVTRWIGEFNQRYIDRGRDPNLWHVDALMTTTRKTFDHWKELVDLYVSLGIRNIHLRPLNPYGFALDTWKSIGYTIDEYLDFYAQTLDYILELNLQGVEIMEGTASVFLTKMLTPDDPNHVDMRSPCGAGTGQVAYNYDGKIFTCDEGRMVSAMGDDLFQIGNVTSSSYTDMLRHPTVRALAMASIQDSLPSCSTCWNKPFCGVCPMHNHMTAGDIHGQRPRSPKCKEHYTISALLLERLANDQDGKIERIFRRWTQARQRVGSSECAV
jgi:His-Xaa-Ser system radical SAM maturase HxsB